MYITKEELEKRLNKTELQIKERERATRKNKDTGQSENRLTHDERVLIGTLAELDSNKNIAELMGVSAQTVSNNSRGIVAPTQGVDKELKEEVERGREEIANDRKEVERQIQEKLVANLAVALGHVADNIYSTDAKEASKIAVDMSKILSSVSGSSNKERGGNRTAIIINVPSMKEEKQYQTITV